MSLAQSVPEDPIMHYSGKLPGHRTYFDGAKIFRRSPGRFLYVLCTFNLVPVSRGKFNRFRISKFTRNFNSVIRTFQK